MPSRSSYRWWIFCIAVAVAIAVPVSLLHAQAAADPGGEKIPREGKVEVKWGGLWMQGTIINHDGPDLFLIQYDHYPASQAEWVTLDRMRAIGSTREVPYARPNRPGVKPPVPAKSGAEPGALQPGAPAAGHVAGATVVQGVPLSPVDRTGAVELKANETWSYLPDAALRPARLAAGAIALNGADRMGGGRDSLFFSSVQSAKAIITHAAMDGSTIEKIDLAIGQSNGVLTIPKDRIPIALSPDGTQILLTPTWQSTAGGRGAAGRVEVWRIDGAEAKPVTAFVATTEQFGGQEIWGAYVDADHVLTLGSDRLLTLWALPGLKAIYTIKLDLIGQPALSSNTKYLIAQAGDHACLFEALAGKAAGIVPDPLPGSQFVFSPDGRQLANYTSDRLQIYSLDAPGGPKVTRQITLQPKTATHRLDWLSDNDLLLGGRDLMDLEKGLVVWQYQNVGSRGGTGSFGGRFYYQLGGMRAPHELASTVLPDEEVKKTVASLDVSQSLAIQPGVKVSLIVNLNCDEPTRQKIVNALTAKLQKNGDMIADNQTIKLTASETAGDSKEISYKLIGRFEEQKVSVADKKLILVFTVDDKTAWTAGTVAAAPIFIHMKKDQSIDQAIAEEQAKSYLFFESVVVPKTVPKPTETLGFGSSILTADGAKRGK